MLAASAERLKKHTMHGDLRLLYSCMGISENKAYLILGSLK